MREDAGASTASLFHAKGPDARRIPPSVSEWLSAQKELETGCARAPLFLPPPILKPTCGKVIRSALMSDPMARYGAARLVDGTTLLKCGIEIPYEDGVESVTKGSWSARAAAFAKLFGKCPDGLKNNLADLEKIRILRNDFAHGFGRNSSVLLPSELDKRPSNRLSHKRFIKYVGVISGSARLIDRYLLTNHIGNFEMLHFYHNHINASPKPEDAGYGPVRALQRCFNRDAGTPVSEEFCTGLVQYYESC